MNEANEIELSKLNDELYQRVTDELSAYRESLREMKADDILGNAYKYTICYDIQCELDCADFPKEQVEALLESPHPLEDIFDVWQSRDSTYMDEIFNTIEQTANGKINAKKLNEQADKALKRDDAR